MTLSTKSIRRRSSLSQRRSSVNSSKLNTKTSLKCLSRSCSRRSVMSQAWVQHRLQVPLMAPPLLEAILTASSSFQSCWASAGVTLVKYWTSYARSIKLMRKSRTSYDRNSSRKVAKPMSCVQSMNAPFKSWNSNLCRRQRLIATMLNLSIGKPAKSSEKR